MKNTITTAERDALINAVSDAFNACHAASDADHPAALEAYKRAYEAALPYMNHHASLEQ